MGEPSPGWGGTLDDLAGVRAWLAGPRDRPLVVDAKIAKFASWVLAHAQASEHDEASHHDAVSGDDAAE